MKWISMIRNITNFILPSRKSPLISNDCDWGDGNVLELDSDDSYAIYFKQCIL